MWDKGSYFLYLYMVFLQHFFYSEQHCFLIEQTFFNVLQIFQTDWVESSTKSSLATNNYCSIDYPVLCHPYFTIVLYQLSSLTIINFIFGVKSCSPTLLVAIYTKFRTPSHQSILCILHFSPLITNGILLAIYLVCWVSLPFLAIHISDLL